VNESDRRRYIRLNHRAVVRVMPSREGGVYECEMHDFSSGGVFFNCSVVNDIAKDSLVEVQTTEFEDAPVVMAKVVRVVEGEGFAVEFIPPEHITR
jgi:PilZ domain